MQIIDINPQLQCGIHQSDISIPCTNVATTNKSQEEEEQEGIFTISAVPSHETIHVVTYSSNGLWTYNQQEIVLIFKHDGEQSSLDQLTKKVTQYYHIVQQYAAKGTLVDDKDYTEIRGTFIGRISGFTYSKQAVPQGVETVCQDVPFLIGVGMTPKELHYCRQYGNTRIHALMGSIYRWYPCPSWIDGDRQCMITSEVEARLQTSLLKSIPKLLLSNVRVRMNTLTNAIQMEICRSSQQAFIEDLGQVVANNIDVFTLLCSFDAQSGVHYVYNVTDSPHQQAIHNVQGGKKSLIGGSFIIFCVVDGPLDIRVIEDGYSMTLNRQIMNQLLAAWQSTDDTDSSINLSGESDDSFKFQFSYVLPEVYDPDTFKAKTTPNSIEPLSFKRMVLLTPDNLISLRFPHTKVLVDIVQLVSNSVQEYFKNNTNESIDDLYYVAVKFETDDILPLFSIAAKDETMISRIGSILPTTLPVTPHGPEVAFVLEYRDE
jgi:hypothetical protein